MAREMGPGDKSGNTVSKGNQGMIPWNLSRKSKTLGVAFRFKGGAGL